MDAKISKKTQDTLGKIIKKPPLTDKLLSKPPFRFLHDILTEIIRSTSFFKGLYTSDEMNSANVKDKDSKIAFLQKAIDVVVMVTGESLSVRPSKVVAGHEPEKTNEFLQAIAKAIQSKTDSSEAVQKVLSGEKPGSGSKSSSKKKESKTSSKEREGSSKENKEDKESSGQKEKDRRKEDERKKEKKEDRESSGDRRKRESMGSRERKDRRSRERSKEREKSGDKERDRERERNKENERHTEKDQDKEREKPRKREKEDESDTIDTGGTAGLIDADTEGDDGSSVNRLPRPSSAKGQRRRPHNPETEGNQQGGDDDEHVEPAGIREDKVDSSEMNGSATAEELPPQVAARRKIPRPSSARPAPPKIRKQEEEQEVVDRIGSGKQVANVIVDDGKDQDEDEDDTFVVVDNAPANQESETAASSEPVEDGEHGALVKKMLETKKELEGTTVSTKTEPERPVVLNAARRKERELVEKEIEKLRTSIQTLCRSANPLGKIMDYIQEDMDSMNKELEMWRKENKEYTIRLKQEESKTQSDIEPLKGEHEELDAEINEMVDKISTVKCNISRNDEKMRQMLSSLSFSTR